MPTSTQELVQGYAHCTDSRCPGNAQEPVDLTKTVTATTYLELGGDLPHVERTHERVWFADEAAATCGVCSGPREPSEQKRPEYQMVHGNQGALLENKENKVRDLEHSSQLAALEAQAQMAEMRTEMEKLRGEVAAQARSKPGPKPKAAEDA